MSWGPETSEIGWPPFCCQCPWLELSHCYCSDDLDLEEEKERKKEGRKTKERAGIKHHWSLSACFLSNAYLINIHLLISKGIFEKSLHLMNLHNVEFDFRSLTVYNLHEHVKLEMKMKLCNQN